MKINKDYLFGKREIDMMKLSGMKPIGITVHNTYNSAPAINEAKNQYNNNTKKGSGGVAVHFFIDENDIYQLLPLDIHGWHAGDGARGAGNRKTIAIEICRSTDYSDDKYARAEQRAIIFIQKLLKDYNFTTKDIYQHKHWSGKKCPHRLIDGNPRTWETFINLIGKDLQPEKPVEKPVEKPTPSTRHKVGDYVTFSKLSTQANGGRVVNALVKGGNITKVYPGAAFPYLIGNNIGFVNDAMIGNAVIDPTPKPPVNQALKVNDRVRVKQGAKSYTGQGIASFVYKNTYVIYQLKGDRAVIGKGSIDTAFKVKDLVKV